MFINLISLLLKTLAIIVPLLISVAYFTIAERKLMGIIQRRKGPNVIGFVGLLQPLADGLKLFSKEDSRDFFRCLYSFPFSLIER